MLSPLCHALLVWVRLDLNQEKLNVLYDPSCSISYFLLIFSLNYSIPTSRQAEFKVTSALRCLFIGFQIQLKRFQNEIFSDQGILHFQNTLTLLNILRTIKSSIFLNHCQTRFMQYLLTEKGFENESIQFSSDFIFFKEPEITLMADIQLTVFQAALFFWIYKTALMTVYLLCFRY